MVTASLKSSLKEAKAGEKVVLNGWVRSKREGKNVAFLAIGDGSMQDNIQLIVDEGTDPWKSLADCTTGAAISAEGEWKVSQGKGQAWEIVVKKLSVLGLSDPEKYPLQKKGHTLEFLRDIGHLRARTNTFGAVFRVRHVLAQAVHRFFHERDFFWAHTPILTASDCEGAGEMFRVTTLDLKKVPITKEGKVDFAQDFFGKEAHLTVSGQLEGEFLALGLGRVYTFGPTFRAENSNTTRHLAEFWMIEPEVAFADLNDNVKLAGEFLKYLCQTVLRECPAELQFFESLYKTGMTAELEKISEATFARTTYTEAVEILKKSGHKFEFPVEWGIDLQSEHERYLTDVVYKGPVVVTDYPKDIKAFYMRLNDDGKTVAAMDVLAPRIGEIIGGSQREERLDYLVKRCQEMKIPMDDLDWYLDLRRFGGCPHAGFGLGFERVVQYVTGMQNIRDTIPCPRTPGNIRF